MIAQRPDPELMSKSKGSRASILQLPSLSHRVRFRSPKQTSVVKKLRTEAAFEVRYHSPGKVGRLAFAIEQTCQAKLRRLGKEVTKYGNEDLLDVLDQKDREELTTEEIEGEGDPQQERNQEFIKQATLMIAGRQDAVREIPYLIDRLCETVAKAACGEEDLSRVERLQERLILGRKQQSFRCLETSKDFRTALHEHAAGFFARDEAVW